MSASELGDDTASVDDDVIDYAKVKAGGIDFTYLRKCQHVYPDPDYPKNAPRARAAGVTVGAYLLPGWGKNAATPKAQIAVLKTSPGDILVGWDLPPALDVESGLAGGFAATGRRPSDLVETLRQLVLEAQDAFGCSPVIYTSWNQWYDLGLPLAPWIADCPLWIKTAYRLRADQPVDQVAPPAPHVGADASDPHDYYRIPTPWKFWVIQQYQGDALGVSGVSHTADVDRFCTAQRGDRGSYVAWLQARVGAFADGDFGPATEDRIRAFQRARSFSETGVVDVATFAAMAWVKV